MTSTAESTRVTRVSALAMLAATAASACALAACGATPPPSSAAAGSHVTTGAGVFPLDGSATGAPPATHPAPVTTRDQPPVASSSPTPTVEALPPNACTAIPGAQVSAWAGGDGAATVTAAPSPPLSDRTAVECSWRLPDAIRQQLGMTVGTAGSADVTVTLARYVSARHGSVNAPWWPTDPDTLVQSYYDAYHRPGPEDPLVKLLPGRPKAVQNGATTLIAQDQQRWIMVSFHHCVPTDCAKQATTFARQLSAAIAVGRVTA